MKEFLHTLKQVLRIEWSTVVGFPLYGLAGGIFGILLTCIIILVEGTKVSYGQIGSLLVLVIGGMVFFLAGMFSTANEFNLAISMGKVRKFYVPVKFVLQFLSLSMLLLESIVIAWIEDLLYPVIFPGIQCELAISAGLLNPMVFVSVVSVGTMLVSLFGALVLRFTSKVYIYIWAVWMFGSLGFSRIASAVGEEQQNFWGELGRNIFSFFANAKAEQMLLVVLAVSLAGLAAAFGLLRKQSVTV